MLRVLVPAKCQATTVLGGGTVVRVPASKAANRVRTAGMAIFIGCQRDGRGLQRRTGCCRSGYGYGLRQLTVVRTYGKTESQKRRGRAWIRLQPGRARRARSSGTYLRQRDRSTDGHWTIGGMSRTSVRTSPHPGHDIIVKRFHIPDMRGSRHGAKATYVSVLTNGCAMRAPHIHG